MEDEYGSVANNVEGDALVNNTLEKATQKEFKVLYYL